MIITVATCIFLAFPLVYTKVCFNKTDTRINDGSAYNKNYYCCDHYERKNEECIECKIGYTSSKGGQCNPCSQDTYGYRCTETCLSCKEYERCDNIFGCTSFFTTTVNLSKLTESLDIIPKTHSPVQPENPYERKDVSNIQSIYAYIFGVGGVFGIILLCTVCYKIRSYKSNNVVIIQVEETNSNAEVSRSENVYDEIDEIDLDEFIQPSNSNTSNVDEISSSSSSADKNSASNVDDYLNPYQPILHTTEYHTYRSISDHVAISSIGRRQEHVRVEICNPSYVNVGPEGSVGKSPRHSKSLYLKYSELEIENVLTNSDSDRYENTSLFQTNAQPKRGKKSQPESNMSNIEYAEIIHSDL